VGGCHHDPLSADANRRLAGAFSTIPPTYVSGLTRGSSARRMRTIDRFGTVER
jgi:hypothetical protein